MKVIIETPYYAKAEARKRIKDDIVYGLNTDGVVILPHGFRATVIESDGEHLEVYFKQDNANKWIPVRERLPEDGEWAIFTNEKQISIERYKSDALDHFYPSARWFNFEDAVAWMPLPEPYKTESEE